MSEMFSKIIFKCEDLSPNSNHSYAYINSLLRKAAFFLVSEELEKVLEDCAVNIDADPDFKPKPQVIRVVAGVRKGWASRKEGQVCIMAREGAKCKDPGCKGIHDSAAFKTEECPSEIYKKYKVCPTFNTCGFKHQKVIVV